MTIRVGMALVVGSAIVYTVQAASLPSVRSATRLERAVSTVQTSAASVLKEPWQSSWSKFVDQIGEYRKTHPDNQFGLMGPVGTQNPDGLEKVDLILGTMLMNRGGPACPKAGWGSATSSERLCSKESSRVRRRVLKR